MKSAKYLLAITLLVCSQLVFAQPGLEAMSVTTNGNGSQTYSLTIQALLLMTALTLLPAGMLMLTSFTRIIIVLAILRTAIGTATTPTNHILLGLALFLTFFVMTPVFDKTYEDAIAPYMEEKIDAKEAFNKARQPFRLFMMNQTRENDLMLFAKISGKNEMSSEDEVPFSVLVPAFMTSELKTAFQIGFLLFIPFLIIDLVVASVLMSMGMMMLSPLIISLPFKIMLFVLVDGWALIMGTLASSFYI